jgi:hypothetical protein
MRLISWTGVVVVNSLFITGANTGQETSQETESRKKDRKGSKGNKTKRKSLYIERSNAASVEEKAQSGLRLLYARNKKRNNDYFGKDTEVETYRQ